MPGDGPSSAAETGRTSAAPTFPFRRILTTGLVCCGGMNRNSLFRDHFKKTPKGADNFLGYGHRDQMSDTEQQQFVKR